MSAFFLISFLPPFYESIARCTLVLRNSKWKITTHHTIQIIIMLNIILVIILINLWRIEWNKEHTHTHRQEANPFWFYCSFDNGSDRSKNLFYYRQIAAAVLMELHFLLPNEEWNKRISLWNSGAHCSRATRMDAVATEAAVCVFSIKSQENFVLYCVHLRHNISHGRVDSSHQFHCCVLLL